MPTIEELEAYGVAVAQYNTDSQEWTKDAIIALKNSQAIGSNPPSPPPPPTGF